MLDTGGGNLLYWEACGNQQGIPALVVHGGPGSGCPPGRRRAPRPVSGMHQTRAGARLIKRRPARP